MNMKKPTVVEIFKIISREKFMLRLVEHEKSFITSRPGVSERLHSVLVAFHGCLNVQFYMC